MTIVFEPHIDIPVGAVAPDRYDTSQGAVPPDDFVVCRTRSGSTASRYGDISWDLSAYHPEERASLLNFSYWEDGEVTPLRDRLSREGRWLMFALIWKRNGSPLSIGSLRNYLSVINALARFAEEKSCRIQDILNNWVLVNKFADSCTGWAVQVLGSLLPILFRLGPDQLGFGVLGDSTTQELRVRGQKYRETIKQHPPIPTRIYSAIIVALSRELDEWESVADSALCLLSDCARDPLMGRCIGSQNATASKMKLNSKEWEHRPGFMDVLRKYELENYFIQKGLTLDFRGLSAQINEMMMVVKLTIQLFSGMRDDESRSLPYHCMETSESNGRTHYLILGRTTKLNQGRIKRTRWVTNREGFRAIQIAQKIADVIYAANGKKPKVSTHRTNDYPLFVSTTNTNSFRGGGSTKSGRYKPAMLQLASFPNLRDRIQPLIEDCDLRELEQIDPHRAWRTEVSFQVGCQWAFTSHQMRRSLALYAQRSGLVSLPSLRRQLQHITEEMSRYYARGSAFARDFIGEDKNHFGLEWQETQPVSEGLSYILHVLLSDETLFGGHANWVEHRVRNSDGIVLPDRKVTLQRFKKGEMAYRETVLGGCVKVGDCDDIAVKWLDVGCVSGCPNMVGSLSKLERVITAQTRLVNSLDLASLEYRSEKSDLDVLVAARNQVRQQQGKDGR